MRGLEVIGPFRGSTGHDRHTREFVRHLVQQGVPAQLTPLEGWSIAMPDGARETWFDALSAPVDADVALHFTMPTLCRPRAGMSNVNYTMFEADRIPLEWVDRAADHDRIVVPTEASRLAWSARGVPDAQLRIVPLAVDGDFLAVDAPPLDITLPDGRPLASYSHRFLNIADLRPRKNHLGLLRTWSQATRADDDAVLILKCTAVHPRTIDLFRRDLAAIGFSFPNAAPVLFMTSMLSDEQLRSLYRSATHYLSMSFGEGWDFPMMEAAVSGLQLIAPRHTAYCEYLGDNDAELIPATAVPAIIEGRAGAEDRRWFNGAHWWKPDEESAAVVIRSIVDGTRPPKASPAARIRREHRWSAAAKRLREVLEELP